MRMGSALVLDTEDDANGVTGDEQFLIGGNDPDLYPRAFPVDPALLAPDHLLVALRVQLDSHPLQAVADAGAHTAGILADAAGEDDGVRAIHGGEIGADVLAGAVGEELHGESRPAIAVLGLLREQLTHVVREAGDAEQAGLLVEYSLNFRR